MSNGFVDPYIRDKKLRDEKKKELLKRPVEYKQKIIFETRQ